MTARFTVEAVPEAPGTVGLYVEREGPAGSSRVGPLAKAMAMFSPHHLWEDMQVAAASWRAASVDGQAPAMPAMAEFDRAFAEARASWRAAA